MSDILIKGMEMPTSCWDCFAHRGVDIGVGVADGCELLKAMIYNPDERLEDCPLVPVPPHGRLIDADALQAEGWTMQRTLQPSPTEMTMQTKLPKNFPTIIPASEEGE